MSTPEPFYIPAHPVLASATVTQIKAGPEPTFEVHVWGDPPNNSRRDYLIRARDDNTAAFEGLRRFGEEMANIAEGAGE